MISPARLHRGTGRICTAVLLCALLASVLSQVGFYQGAVAQEDGPVEDLVPFPSADVGISDWNREVVQHGAPLTEPLQFTADATVQALPGDTSLLEIKFAHGAAVTAKDGRFEGLASASVQAVLDAAPGAFVDQLFDRPAEELHAERVEAERISGQAQPDLSLWFLVSLPNQQMGQTVVDALNNPDRVPAGVLEMVQPTVPLSGTAPQLPTQASEEVNQYYLDGGTGIDAEYAWTQAGGSGSNVTIAAIDSGFDLNHYDMDKASAAGVIIPTYAGWDERHGTRVLGIIMADNDGVGARGIVSEASIRTANSGTSSSRVANSINQASALLGPGDVITVSQGICPVSGCATVLPLTHGSSTRDALRLATARGVITVVSAGNGGTNLDSWSARLGADSPSTIVVGAGNPPSVPGCSAQSPARGRLSTSNHGSRVDLQGWGACLRTTHPGNQFVWWGFTSGATPMVAGAAASLSSYAEATRGINLTGDQVKLLLQNTGLAQVAGLAGNIGPQPNLNAAINNVWLIPNNDMVSNAAQVPSLPYSSNLQTVWAGVQVDEPSITCGTVAHSVWYRYTPPVNQTVTIDTTSSNYDTVLGLWELTNGSLARRDCNNSAAASVSQAQITADLQAGRTYYIQVAGHNGASGSMQFSMSNTRGEAADCDFTGDGQSDLVLGLPSFATNGQAAAGAVLAVYGRPVGQLGAALPMARPSANNPAPGANQQLGAALACGDFDGDGDADLAFGAPGDTIGNDQNAGAVEIWDGNGEGLSQSPATRVHYFHQDLNGLINTAEPNDRFGQALAAGDFNNDGYDDLAVGVPDETRYGISKTGMVHVLYGSSTGLRAAGEWEIAQDSPGVYGEPEAGDRFGSVLATGDVNGDGYDDLAIGIPNEDVGKRVDAGAVTVVFGSAGGLATQGSQTFTQNTSGIQGAAEKGDLFGGAIAVGDTTGDGLAEVVVGSPGEGVNGRARAGAAHLFKGTTSGITFAGDHFIYQGRNTLRGGPETNDAFASALALGDINGDGKQDLVIGAPGEGIGNRGGAGLIHVILGAGSGLDYNTNIYLHQDSNNIPGSTEPGDALGATVRLLDLDGDGRTEVVAGAPGEDIGTARDGGWIMMVPSSSAGVSSAGTQTLAPSNFGFSSGNVAGTKLGEVIG